METKMKGKIFSSSEVQSIVAGNKTQFREVIKVQPEEQLKGYFYLPAGSTGFCESLFILDQCPYKIRQTIFVKESFGFTVGGFGEYSERLTYKQSNPNAIYAKTTLSKEVPVLWKPAQLMKQEQARIILEVANISMERLAEISKEDAIKEGFCKEIDIANPPPIEKFANHWNATHKKVEHKWEANPFVWVIDFTFKNLC